MSSIVRRGATLALLGFVVAAAAYFDLGRSIDRAFSELGRS